MSEAFFLLELRQRSTGRARRRQITLRRAQPTRGCGAKESTGAARRALWMLCQGGACVLGSKRLARFWGEVDGNP